VSSTALLDRSRSRHAGLKVVHGAHHHRRRRPVCDRKYRQSWQGNHSPLTIWCQSQSFISRAGLSRHYYCFAWCQTRESTGLPCVRARHPAMRVLSGHGFAPHTDENKLLPWWLRGLALPRQTPCRSSPRCSNRKTRWSSFERFTSLKTGPDFLRLAPMIRRFLNADPHHTGDLSDHIWTPPEAGHRFFDPS